PGESPRPLHAALPARAGPAPGGAALQGLGALLPGRSGVPSAPQPNPGAVRGDGRAGARAGQPQAPAAGLARDRGRDPPPAPTGQRPGLRLAQADPRAADQPDRAPALRAGSPPLPDSLPGPRRARPRAGPAADGRPFWARQPGAGAGRDRYPGSLSAGRPADRARAAISPADRPA